MSFPLRDDFSLDSSPISKSDSRSSAGLRERSFFDFPFIALYLRHQREFTFRASEYAFLGFPRFASLDFPLFNAVVFT